MPNFTTLCIYTCKIQLYFSVLTYYLLTDILLFSGTVQLHPQHGSLQLAALPATDKRPTQRQHHAGQPGPPHPHWCVLCVFIEADVYVWP